MCRVSLTTAAAALTVFTLGFHAVVATTWAADQAELVARVDRLAGFYEKDNDGNVTVVDFLDRPATDNDLKLLAAAPKLQTLILWGANHRCRRRTSHAAQRAH